MALKKKKMYETQLEQCENNILRVNEQQMMLENQRTTVETVTALRDAAHASKSTMSEMKITDVDQVQRGFMSACMPFACEQLHAGVTGDKHACIPLAFAAAC
jgi:hypothetical protein